MTVRSKTMQPKDWAVKAPDYIREGRLLGIEIHPPYVNKSSDDFSIQNDEIYFGFNAIQGIGKTAAKQVIKARGNKSFEDIFDFLNRVNLSKFNTGSFKSLVLAGAFDKLGYNRLSLYNSTEALFDYVRGVPEYQERLIEIKIREKENAEKTQLLGEKAGLVKELKKLEKQLKKNPTPELQSEIDSIEDKLLVYEAMSLNRKPALKEKEQPAMPELIKGSRVCITLPEIIAQGEYIGCYIDHHPSKIIGSECNKLNSVFSGEEVTICAVISGVKEATTKTGAKMAFLNIGDDTGVAEVIAFSNVWINLDRDKLNKNRLAYITGIVEDDDEPVKIKAKRIVICEVESIE